MLIKANRILGKQHIPNICKTNQNSSWIMQCIKKAVTGSSKMMKQQKFRFEDGRMAAKYNTKILKQCKYDFEKALEKEKGTMLEPGSEFREYHLLQPIFQHCEHWMVIKEFIATGVTYNLTVVPTNCLVQ